LIQGFYHGLTPYARSHLYAAAIGSFTSLNVAQAKKIIKKIVTNQEWNDERPKPKKSRLLEDGTLDEEDGRNIHRSYPHSTMGNHDKADRLHTSKGKVIFKNLGLVVNQAKIIQGINKRLLDNDKTLELLTSKMDSLASAVKDQ